MCTVLLPPGDNPIAVNKYININNRDYKTYFEEGGKAVKWVDIT